MTSRYRCYALTNWAMKPPTLGAGHLWAPMFPWRMNQRWNDIWNGSYMNCGYEIKWSYDPHSYGLNFSNCGEKPEKFRPYDPFHIPFHRGFLTPKAARTNQLSYACSCPLFALAPFFPSVKTSKSSLLGLPLLRNHMETLATQDSFFLVRSLIFK